MTQHSAPRRRLSDANLRLVQTGPTLERAQRKYRLLSRRAVALLAAAVFSAVVWAGLISTAGHAIAALTR